MIFLFRGLYSAIFGPIIEGFWGVLKINSESIRTPKMGQKLGWNFLVKISTGHAQKKLQGPKILERRARQLTGRHCSDSMKFQKCSSKNVHLFICSSFICSSHTNFSDNTVILKIVWGKKMSYLMRYGGERAWDSRVHELEMSIEIPHSKVWKFYDSRTWV